MNKLINYLFISVFALFFSNSLLAKDGYDITIKVKGIADTVCYLAYHYGHQVYVEDTFTINKNGVCNFKGNKILAPGIYVAVLPKSKFFEFLVPLNEQKFTIETDTSDFTGTMKVTGSKENELFSNYQKFLNTKQKALKQLDEQVIVLKKTSDSTKLNENKDFKKIQEQYKVIQNEINTYRKDIIKNNPKSYIANIFNAMQEPDVPETPKNDKGAPIDSFFAHKYFKAHFWDNINFADTSLLRTPIFYNKIKQYLETLTVRHPDSINKSADIILQKAKISKSSFRYALVYISHTYETSNIMGMDAVFVYLAKNYYLKGEAWWLDSAKLAKVDERYNKLRYTLINNKAVNLTMQDTLGKDAFLYNVNAPYTLVVFYDTDCGHCKKEMPHYVELYDKYHKQGLEIYAVVKTGSDEKKWKEFIKEKDMHWTYNVIDKFYHNDYHTWYDVYSTPTTYLLDKDKKIMYKRLSAEQYTDIISKEIEKSTVKKP